MYVPSDNIAQSIPMKKLEIWVMLELFGYASSNQCDWKNRKIKMHLGLEPNNAQNIQMT